VFGWYLWNDYHVSHTFSQY